MTKSTGTGRGRRAGTGKPLRLDPDRYAIAVVYAMNWHERKRSQAHFSIRAVANTAGIAGQFQGLEQASQALNRMHDSATINPFTPKGMIGRNGDLSGAAVVANAERIRKKLSRLIARNDPDDLNYLASLSLAVFAASNDTAYGRAWDVALKYCTEANEVDWFVSNVAPAIKERFGLT